MCWQRLLLRPVAVSAAELRWNISRSEARKSALLKAHQHRAKPVTVGLKVAICLVWSRFSLQVAFSVLARSLSTGSVLFP